MSRARLLLLALAVCHRRGVRNYGEASADDPVVSQLRAQLMANNYDYEESESGEKALREGGAADGSPRTDDHTEGLPSGNLISDESELSDFGLDRNVLNGYITDMSDLQPVPRGEKEPETGQIVNNLSDAEQGQPSESEPDGAPPAGLSEERERQVGLSLPEQALAPVELRPRPDPAEKQSQPRPDPAEKQSQPRPDPAEKQSQPKPAPAAKQSHPRPAPAAKQSQPIMRAHLNQIQDEESQPEQVADEQELKEVPVEWSEAPQDALAAEQPARRQIHVVSPYLAGQRTTEGIPFKVLTGHGQKHGRRSGAELVNYLQTQFNDTVVVAPLGPGPMPDFQLPRGRRQYREISDDEDQEEDLTSTQERTIDRRRTA